MASLSFRHIYKKYPGGVTAVSDFCLEVKDKEFLILVGPSGCGKSTTLRMIAGLEEITEGELFIGDKLVNDIAPKDRDIAMVFQNYALYPHMTVFDNMAFGLKLRKVPKEEIKRKVEQAAKILDITHLLDRRPKQLSGGQKQRVALGRAIVRNPKVFLLDEPLSNLDAKLRASMRTELTKLHKRLGTTFVYVTHDQVEAMTMASRIVVMRDGLIQQVDTPQNLYDLPVNLFVAGFIGTPQMNFIDAKLIGKGEDVIVHWGEEEQKDKPSTICEIKLPADKASAPELKDYIGKEVIVGVRPECLRDDEPSLQASPDTVVDANVEVTELMGNEIYLYMNAGEQNLIARVNPRSTTRSGDTVKICIDATRVHIFDKDTEKCIIH
ncbi:MAG: sn-glycerol-3-phosphate ABC transporter ATP-binding protein UgpC [Clostridia bacterium]|nr:sn-glycerol-3-phosphate ABC transporter ATP-binding protein UgpC [Clostridia bacterium]